MSFVINNQHIGIDDIAQIIEENLNVQLGDEAISAVNSCRDYLDHKIQESDRPIYGINTGFGSLCDTSINKQELNKLQENLVKSHATGMGDEVSKEIVKLMLLLKVIGLAKGYSGVQLSTIERLIAFFNHGVTPIVYEQGSLGASGDLAPLAHLSLPLIGLGEVYFEGQKMTAEALNRSMGWDNLVLNSKEGLALLNGTQFMSAHATYVLIKSKQFSKCADFIASASLDAYHGSLAPFHSSIHSVRPHQGQIQTAAFISELLSDSDLIKESKPYVQDPYSFRCVPQVHGASKDTIAHAQKVVEVEINSVTDNPTVFKDEDAVISAGNFHGQPLALVLDFMAIALSELASISERRVYKLLSGTRGLPAFLIKNPGLNSGFMIAQYSAASIVSQNKQLCMPASVDTIDSSNGQEDHVSMGANAATKLKRVSDNLQSVLGIEWMTACQALEFRNKSTSKQITKHIQAFRREVPFIEGDQVMYPLIQQSREFIGKMDLG